MRPGQARIGEDATDNLRRTVKRMKKQMGAQSAGDLEARLSALESKVQGQALSIGRLRAALKRAGVQAEEDG